MSNRKWEHRLRAATVLDYIRRNPEKHNQETWFTNPVLDNPDELDTKGFDTAHCGTTLCAAGTAVWLEDGKKGLKLFNKIIPWDVPQFAGTNEGHARAAELLGLDEAEADNLFLYCDEEQAVIALKRLVKGKRDLFKGLDI